MKSKSYWILCSLLVAIACSCATGSGFKLRSDEAPSALLKQVTLEGWDEGVEANAVGVSLISQSAAESWLKLPEADRPKAVFDSYCKAGESIRSLKTSFLVPLPRLQGEVIQTVNTKRREFLDQVRYLLRRDWLFALAARVEDRGRIDRSSYSKFTAIPTEWSGLSSWVKEIYTNGANATRCESPRDGLEVPAALDQDKNLRCRLMLVEGSGKPIWLAPHAPVGFLESGGDVLLAQEKYPDAKAEFTASQMVGSRYSASGMLQSGHPQLIPGPAGPGAVFEHGGKVYTGLRSHYFVEARALIEGYTFVLPRTVYAREFPADRDANGHLVQDHFGHDESGKFDMEAAVYGRSDMWERFLDKKTVIREAATKDPNVIQFSLELDPNLLCAYGRPVQDLISR